MSGAHLDHGHCLICNKQHDLIELDFICMPCAVAATRYKWISVKDELPENKQVVLVYNEFGETAVCTCNKTVVDFIFMLYETSHQVTNVTHWMPLPEPPK